MTTAGEVFDDAIHLMDEQDERNGKTHTIDTDEYRFRTLGILNTMIPLLSPYSTLVVQEGTRENFLKQKDYENPDLNQVIPLDDNLIHAIAPHYLADHLLRTENPELAALFERSWRGAMNELIPINQKGKWEKIQLPYGLF